MCSPLVAQVDRTWRGTQLPVTPPWCPHPCTGTCRRRRVLTCDDVDGIWCGIVAVSSFVHHLCFAYLAQPCVCFRRGELGCACALKRFLRLRLVAQAGSPRSCACAYNPRCAIKWSELTSLQFLAAGGCGNVYSAVWKGSQVRMTACLCLRLRWILVLSPSHHHRNMPHKHTHILSHPVVKLQCVTTVHPGTPSSCCCCRSLGRWL